MEFMNSVTDNDLDFSESISYVLLTEVQLNDANRILAGLRRPSKQHREILQDLRDIRRRRAEINSIEAK